MNELGNLFNEIRGTVSPLQERRINWDLARSEPSVLHVMEWDDAVTISIRVLCSRWILTIFLWMISYILAMIQLMYGGILTLFIFIPLWIGR